MGSTEVENKPLENLLKRRFFYNPSFEIYGSTAGLFDLGPSGCALKNELESVWRRHFVLEENLMEISTPNLTPHAVLKSSGHVDRFLDLMVEDVDTHECYRADKLIGNWFDHILSAEDGKTVTDEKRKEIEDILVHLEGMSAEEMKSVIVKHNIKSPAKHDLTDPFPFNLMFSTKIGPKPVEQNMNGVAYLRPETAQGIFVNFKRLLDQSNGKMPFGAACVGTSFRNEIAPRNGLLRVREFPMAEIEFFCDPLKKSPFPKFNTIENMILPLYSRDRQINGQSPLNDMTLKQAVEQKVIDNEILAYFIARTYLFLTKIGIDTSKIRFRQHLSTEMAHYASDCWDAEILTAYKWIECVGIADRSAFDLIQHAEATKTDLQAVRQLDKPRLVKKLIPKPNRKVLGPKFKQTLADLLASIEALDQNTLQSCLEQLNSSGTCQIQSQLDPARKYDLDKDLLSIEYIEKEVSEESYVPNVIEPSFGIGRLLYAVLENAFRSRGVVDQEDRNYLAFSPLIAPQKCSIIPMSNQPQFIPFIEKMREKLLNLDLSVRVDYSSATIGKRYARTDEIGIPFGITIDFQTLTDNSVTLREVNTMSQIRTSMDEIPQIVKDLCTLRTSWDIIVSKYPSFETQQA